MVNNIFATVAPAYWAKGLPVVPVRKGDKAPAIHGWNLFADTMPTQGEQDHWLASFPDCNIGMILGSQSDIFAIDLDRDDPVIVRAVEAALSMFPTPYKKVGSKGFTLFFRQPQGEALKPFKIKGADGAGIIDGLSTKNNVVLPPSIHPKTNKPYTSTAELLDVYEQLPRITREVEALLRGALKDAGVELSFAGHTKITEYTSAGARDSQMTKMAGFWAAGVIRGELSLLEAIGRMEAWYASCVEKVAGDDIDIRKGIQNLIGFLTRDVVERKKILPEGWDKDLDEDLKKSLGLSFDSSHEEWPVETLKTYLFEEFSKHEMDSLGRRQAIEHCLERMASATNLTELDRKYILRYISESSASTYSLTDLKARISEIGQGAIKGANHNEIAQAVLDHLNTEGKVAFCDGCFWQWNGAYWEEMDKSAIMNVIASEFGFYMASKKHGDHQGIHNTLRDKTQAKSLKEVSTQGINFANGFLTTEQKLIPHSADLGCRYMLPFRYLEGAGSDARMWHAFLDRVWGEDPDFEQKKAGLQEAMCATLFGIATRYQRAFLLYGVPGSGKSQILRVVEELVPKNARSCVPPHMWGDKFMPAEMAGKLLNIAGEIHEKKKIDGTMLKEITEGKEIEAQFKYGQSFRFHPVAAHWFAGNHLPKTDDTSDGFNRRWLMFEFRRKIKSDEKIVDYGARMAGEEREQIVSWAIEALPRLVANNEYTISESHKEKMEDTANQNNSVRFFMTRSGRVRVAPAPPDGEKISLHTSEIQLHNAYSGFCRYPAGVEPVSLLMFGQKMNELAGEMGFSRRMKNTGEGFPEAVYCNITLVDARSL